MSSATRYSNYDSIAWVYDKHWGHLVTQLSLTVFEKLVQQHVPPKASIPDLCCGTG
jgi:ubiquinone/menaquinone biosynthesis C-methylase UbiE